MYVCTYVSEGERKGVSERDETDRQTERKYVCMYICMDVCMLFKYPLRSATFESNVSEKVKEGESEIVRERGREGDSDIVRERDERVAGGERVCMYMCVDLLFK